MRSACNQIRFDFSTIDKETHPAGGYKPDQRLRDKKITSKPLHQDQAAKFIMV